jgi:hypothetical protein
MWELFIVAWATIGIILMVVISWVAPAWITIRFIEWVVFKWNRGV